MDLTTFLAPRSLAVVGLSRSNPFHPANVIYHKNHLRYGVRTYAVNPAGGEVFGEPLYRSLAELPEPVDLAVLAVRADRIPALIAEAAAAGVRGAVVISGGFAEAGHPELQDALAAAAIEHELPVIGPNCIGVFAPPAVDTFFLPYERLVDPLPGSVSIVSQSGGILVDLLIQLTEERVGVARAISIGNKAVLDEVDLLQPLFDDPATAVIGVYVEGFRPGRGRRFVELARTAPKPIVLLKAGKTPGGSRAVSSHTASLAGDYRTFHEVISATPAIEATDEAEFVAFCEALSTRGSLPTPRVGVVTASGGHGAIASDACYTHGLQLMEFGATQREALRARLTPSVQPIAGLGDPVDLTGSATDADFCEATRFLLEQDDIDGAIVLLLPYLPALTPDVGARIAQIARIARKPVVAYVPHVDKYGIFIEGFEANGVPVSHSVEGAVRMAAALARRGEMLAARGGLDDAAATGPGGGRTR